MKKNICIFLAILCVVFIAICDIKADAKINNPHGAKWIKTEMFETLDSIKRIDKQGLLYEMNYTSDYYDSVIVDVVKKAIKMLDTGCSAFSIYNTSKEFLMYRNYDYLHKDSNGNHTGLTVVIHTAPKGKLKSVSICDAYWLNPSAYYKGVLDDGKTDTSALLLAPYMCVDGMNEAGLAASLLYVDLKDGEKYTNQNTGKNRITHSILLRYIIDNAHNIKEAEEIARSYDIYSIGNSDLHIYLSDKNGNAAVFEWRKDKLYVTYTNAVTNFFVGFNDGKNIYNKDGSLKELFAKFKSTFNNYKYGYGHGYHRFNTIIASLERYIQTNKNEHGIRNSIMKESQGLDILRVVAQDPGTEKTSYTQYSAIYNLENISIKLWLDRDYGKFYTFKL